MDRALVAISILLAAAAEPPAAAPPAPDATAATPPQEPTEPASAPVAASEETHASTADEAAPAAVDGGDAAAVAAATIAAQVPTVDVQKLTDDTVCRKERPTGSLIGVMRCYSRSATIRDDPLLRRDVEDFRMRHSEQQAREAAAAMSRRRGSL